MAYNQQIAQRLRNHLANHPEIVEKKMFGGIGFLWQGNMACGINGDDLIVRVGPDQFAEALRQPHTRPFDMSGRPMAGWVMVGPSGWESDNDLDRWIAQGLKYASTLPAK